MLFDSCDPEVELVLDLTGMAVPEGCRHIAIMVSASGTG